MKPMKSVSAKYYRGFLILIAIFLISTVTASCGPKNGQPENLIIPAAGGQLELKNGIELVVPPNAVNHDVEITLSLVDNEEVKDFLADSKFPTQPLIFFEVSDNIILNKSIRVILPIKSADLEDGWPIHVVVDRETGMVDYRTTGITYDPEAGILEFSLDHFSTNGVAKKEDADGDKKCNDPGGACRCGKIYVESSFHDYSIGDCQSVSDEVKVQFLDCPGQPTESHKMSEFAGDCTAMGTLDFTFELELDGIPVEINCDGPIPFVIGSSDKILGGGPTTCAAVENILGANIDILIRQQVSLSGEFDGQKLNFDPPQAENANGHITVTVIVDGSEVTVMDVVFGDDAASLEFEMIPGMPIFSTTVSADDDYEMSDLSFFIPLDTTGEAEVVISGEGSSAILKVFMELTY